MLAEKNYVYNSRFTFPESTINGQGSSKVSLCRYGLFPMSWNGCEIIALYNFCFLKGEKAGLADIARKVYPVGSVLWGFFGTDPRKVEPFFRAHSFEVNKETNLRRFLANFEEAGLGVLSFWTRGVLRSSVHTVCVQKAGNGVLVYNWSNGRPHPLKLGALTEFLSRSAFIVGYTPEEK